VEDDVEPSRYFFVHLQKTAGTALWGLLRRQFGPDAVYPGPVDEGNRNAVVDVEHLLRRFAADRDQLRVLTGHFPLCTCDLLDAPFSTFTVLREPVERTLSFLRQQQEAPGPFHGRPLEEIYADPLRLLSLIHNHMVKMLSLTADEMDAGAMTLVEFDDARLETAKRNLAERIDLYGFQEEFDRFCGRLDDRFGWDLGQPWVTNTTAPVEVSDEFRARVAHDNHLDVELYRWARAQAELAPS